MIWDNVIGRTIKHELNFWNSTATAMIREDTSNYGLGAPSISVEFHRRLATALTLSLEDPTRHRNVTFNLLNKQIAHLTDLSDSFLSTRETDLHIKRLLDYSHASYLELTPASCSS